MLVKSDLDFKLQFKFNMLAVKVILGFFLTVFAISALVPLLGVGVLVPSLTAKIFDKLDELVDTIERKLLGKRTGSPPEPALPVLNFDMKSGAAWKRLLIIVTWNVVKATYLSIWFFLRGVVFLFVEVPNAVGEWCAKFATLRSILTTRPLDADEVDRADASTLSKEELKAEEGEKEE